MFFASILQSIRNTEMPIDIIFCGQNSVLNYYKTLLVSSFYYSIHLLIKSTISKSHQLISIKLVEMVYLNEKQVPFKVENNLCMGKQVFSEYFWGKSLASFEFLNHKHLAVYGSLSWYFFMFLYLHNVSKIYEHKKIIN